MDDDIPYLLLTPGPLTTSKSVKQVMMQDFCTWDDDYNSIVTGIRSRLAELVGGGDATAVLVQGSGTFAVEATIGSVIPPGGKLLVVNNGAYGNRMRQIAERLRIDGIEITQPEIEPADVGRIDATLAADAAAGRVVKARRRGFIVDAMSSFGGIPMTIDEIGADFLVSSANKCIQGVPGFGFVIARRAALEATTGYARSLSLDLYDQWLEMETHGGKWRFTSPTHTVRAFAQALQELEDEGGVPARHARYCENARRLGEGMTRIGFRPLLPEERRSPIITSFVYPSAAFDFMQFYEAMKRRRFVLYPGKVSTAETFRIGTIGHVFRSDIDELIASVADVVAELGISF